MAQRIQLRRGTAAEWAAANPVLALGEPGVETDTGKQKFGDGVTAWNARPYASKGDKGDQGAPGIADDASVAQQVTSGPETVAALNATYATASAVAAKADSADVVPKWKANTSYAAGAPVVNPSGDLVTAKIAFTSGASYSATNWNASPAVAAKLDTATASTLYASKTIEIDDMVRAFQGVDGWAYGNSWINSANYGAQQYPFRLVSKMGLKSMTELASSGFRMQDTAVSVIGTDASLNWPANRKGFVVVGDLLNNLIEADTTANRDTALESMRAVVALLSASSRIEETDSAFTYSGSWSTLTTPTVSGGTAKYIAHTVSNTTEGVSYIDVAVPAGLNYLCFVGTMAGSATNGGTAIIREGATELGRIATDDKTVSTPYGAATGTRAPVVFRVPGTTARTLRITFTGTSSTASLHTLLVDCLLPQSTTPPLVVLVKPLQTLIATHDKPDLLTYLRTIPDTVKAEFGDSVVVVDPAAGWDPATMLGADLLHPNEAGQNHVANAVVKGLKAEMLRRARLSTFGTLT